VKKLLILAGFLFLTIFTIFAGGGKAKTRSGDGKLNITFVTPLAAHPVWNAAREGFEAAAAEFGFNAICVGPRAFDPAEMVNQIEIALASGADAIITVPAAPETMRPVIRKCVNRGVPVVFAGAEDDLPKSLVSTGTGEEELSRADAMAAYQNALVLHPELKCLLGICGETGPAATEVVNEPDGKDTAIVTIDDTPEGLDYAESGVIYGTMPQNFYKRGYEAAGILYEYLTNGTLPAGYKNDLGCIFVNKDNINTYMASLRK
jgi:ABC-type sugar transport system substrate-binding protein